MFFAPTILALTEQHHGVARRALPAPELLSLTLSTGDADGLGETRKMELENSLDVLGVAAGKRWVVEHPYVAPAICLLGNNV